MKTRYRIIGSFILVAAVVAVGAAVAYAKYVMIEKDRNTPPPPEMPVAVRVRPTTAVTYRQQTTVIGTVLAPQSIMLSNEIAGTVKSIGFQPGSVVEKGQVLIELDTSVEQAELLSAQARVRLTRSTMARIRRAATSDAVTAAEVDEAEAQADQAAAMVEQLKAVIDRKTLRAPFRGKIGLSNTHLGQFLPSGFQIASLQSIEDYLNIDFMIPQSAADWVRVGDQVALSDDQKSVTATVVALDARADRMSRNLMGRAKLSPVPADLVPGDSVRVTVEYGPNIESVAVPPEAIRRAPMDTFVYVVETDQKKGLRAHARTVSVGKTIAGNVTVLAGLKPDEIVVADGSFKLREGALILDADAVPPAPTPTKSDGSMSDGSMSDGSKSDGPKSDGTQAKSDTPKH